MERRPPPAPARAWATLSACWAAVVGWAIFCDCEGELKDAEYGEREEEGTL